MSEIAISGKQEKSVKPDAELLVNNSAAAAAGDANAAEASTEPSSPKGGNKKLLAKRTPSKRMSFIERAQKESEELVKNMGGSLELDGGRRTRSSARGTPSRAAVASPTPPVKKSRASPTTAKTMSPRARGRGRKIITSEEADELPAGKLEKSSKKEPTPNEHNDVEKSSGATAENSVTETANAVADEAEVGAKPDAAASKASKEKPKGGVETKGRFKVQTVGKQVKEPEVNEAKTSVDHPNAALPSIPEDEPNNVDHGVPDKAEKTSSTAKPEQKESLNKETPMETDEEPATAAVETPATAAVETPVEATPKATNATDDDEQIKKAETESAEPEAPKESAAAVEKQPTPEPMEVDSSSKSNDDVIEMSVIAPAVVSASDVPAVEVMDEEVAEIKETATANASTSNDDAKLQKNDIKSLTMPQEANAAPAEQKAEAEEESKVGEKTNDETPVKDDGKSTPATPVASDANVEAKATSEPASSSDDAATEIRSATTPVSVENSKSGNDFCEAKITSPPVSAAGEAVTAVSKPQYCN